MSHRAKKNNVEIPQKLLKGGWNGKVYRNIVYLGGEPYEINSAEYQNFLKFSIAGSITSSHFPELELKGTFSTCLSLEFNNEKLEEPIMTHLDWESQLFAWAKKIDETWGLAKAYFGNFLIFIIGTKTESPKYQLILKDEQKIHGEQYLLARWAIEVTFMGGALLEYELQDYEGTLTAFESTIEEEIKKSINP